MKEQIEEILSKHWDNYLRINKYNFLREATDDILALIPNNDWLEYPKHKPRGNGEYVVITKNNVIKIYHLQCHFNDQGKGILEFEDNVIAFKPIPIEPFKPKNKYVEFLNALNMYLEVGDEFAVAHRITLQELKAKIENGDLK
jgi:hypothetical protein